MRMKHSILAWKIHIHLMRSSSLISKLDVKLQASAAEGSWVAPPPTQILPDRHAKALDLLIRSCAQAHDKAQVTKFL